MTYVNGKEFAYYEEIARELAAEGFFAHPFHSWERGPNEDTNGLIRQYIPKGKDIDNLSDEDVAEIIEKINSCALIGLPSGPQNVVAAIVMI